MTDYSKMRCYDMRMYLFEWASYNPEAGIKYIHNMSKSQLTQICQYTEDRLSKDELIDIINVVKNSLKENKKRLKNNAPETVYYTADEDEGEDSDDDEE